MRSTTRFLEGTLLGVALGVALGFLFFQKPVRRVWQNLLSSSPDSAALEGMTIEPCLEDERAGTQPWAVQASEYEAFAAVVATESEVFVAPEVLEEPLPGAGWEPTTTALAEEELAEAATPAAAELDAYASIEVEPLDFESIPVWAETPAPEPEVVPDVEAAAEKAVEESEDVAAEPVALVESPAEARMTEPEAEEALPTEREVLEPEAADWETAEAEIAEPGVEDVEVEAVPLPTTADDLKARIEETRRRIRRELEQPFIVGAGVDAAESVSPGFEPVIGEALAVEPSAEGGAGLQAPESAAPAEAEAEASSSAALEEPPTASGDELGVDYEAMRGRIEETRSRLKAKAFDAMMTGESALLGRDPQDVSVKLPTPTEVDGEIGMTIDSTLTEEEV